MGKRTPVILDRKMQADLPLSPLLPHMPPCAPRTPHNPHQVATSNQHPVSPPVSPAVAPPHPPHAPPFTLPPLPQAGPAPPTPPAGTPPAPWPITLIINTGYILNSHAVCGPPFNGEWEGVKDPE